MACAGPAGVGRDEAAAVGAREYARPESDPSARETALDKSALSGIEQVTVRVARAPDGSVRVVGFLTPGLTEAQKAEIASAVERGDLAPGAAAEGVRTWITTLRRAR